ncbi:MAG: Flp1 family type IVb pilin [Eubacteriales bacterium]|nr:Flp1 family type IVb pilin [Eubacteriales bacterium]
MIYAGSSVRAAACRLRRRVTAVLRNEDGVGTVEVVLLILVAVGLVLIFRDRITELVSSIFNKITSQAGKI